MCAAAPRQRRWLLVDRVDVSRARPGLTVNARLDGIPMRDSLGRIGHVAGLWIQAAGAFTLAAESDPVSSFRLLSIWDSIFLRRSDGWQYYNGTLDGRDMVDDVYFRHYRRARFPSGQDGFGSPTAYPTIDLQTSGLGADGDDDVTVDMSWYTPLSQLGVNGLSLTGLVPVAALQLAGNNAFQFSILPNVKGAAPTGVTFNGLYIDTLQTRAGINIWVDVVYLPATVVDTWMLENYSLPESSGMLHWQDRVSEYVQMRFRDEDDVTGTAIPAGSGRFLVNSFQNLSLQVAGFDELGGAYTRLEMMQRQAQIIMQSLDSDLESQNAFEALPVFGPCVPTDTGTPADYQNLILWGRMKEREACPAGPMQFNINGRLNSFTRFVHRTAPCLDERAAADIIKAAGCQPCGFAQPTSYGGLGKVDSGVKPLVVFDKQAIQKYQSGQTR
jgi:hypothetical protein